MDTVTAVRNRILELCENVVSASTNWLRFLRFHHPVSRIFCTGKVKTQS